MCPSCGFTTGEMSEEQLEVFRLRRLRDKLYHLNMISYSVITAFVGGSGGFQYLASPGPFILMGLAAVAYLVVRAMLFRNRQKQKTLRKKIHMA